MHHRSKQGTPFWGIILVIAGLLFLFNNLDIVSLHDVFHNFWPLILIVIGLYAIIKSIRRSEPDEKEKTLKEGINLTAGDEDVFESNVFGDVKVNVNSKNFRKGTIRTVFGKLIIDLSDINVAEGENNLYLNTVFGEIRVKMAKDLPVKITATNLGGDIDIFDQRREGLNQRLVYLSDNYNQAETKLNIHCSVTFGEIFVW